MEDAAHYEDGVWGRRLSKVGSPPPEGRKDEEACSFLKPPESTFPCQYLDLETLTCITVR